MLETITSEVVDKLEEIGFEQDEINVIQILHELKNRTYPVGIKKLINQAAFENLSKGIVINMSFIGHILTLFPSISIVGSDHFCSDSMLTNTLYPLQSSFSAWMIQHL